MILVVVVTADSDVKLTCGARQDHPHDVTYSVENMVSQCMETECSAYHCDEVVHEASLRWDLIEVALHGVPENASLFDDAGRLGLRRRTGVGGLWDRQYWGCRRSGQVMRWKMRDGKIAAASLLE